MQDCWVKSAGSHCMFVCPAAGQDSSYSRQ